MKNFNPISLLFALVLSAFASPAFSQLWQRTTGPGGAVLSEIAYDSAGYVYALSNNVYRSTDNGTTWVQLASKPSSIHVLPNGKLVAKLNNGIAISVDHADSWTRVLDQNASFATTIEGKIYVAGANNLFRTTNDGVSWDTLPPTPYQAEIFAFSTHTIFALSADHRDFGAPMYRSTDDGTSWSKVVNGLSLDRWYGDDLAGTAGGGMMYVCRNNRSVSTDDGRTWKAISSNNDINPRVAASRAGYFATFTGSIDIYDLTGKKIKTVGQPCGYFDSKATPDGGFWIAGSPQVFKVDPMAQTSTSFIIPTGSVSTLAALSAGNVLGLANGLLYRTTDGGTTWGQLSGADLQPIAFDSAGGLIAGKQGGLYRSTDNGSTWTQLGPTLSNGVSSIVVDGSGYIYVGSYEGVFRSSDNGATWDQLNSGLTQQSVTALAVSSSGTVFAATNNRLFVSSDHALTWQGLPNVIQLDSGGHAGIKSLVISTAGDLLVAMPDSGIYWSHDSGVTWSPIGSGLSGKVNCLLSTPIGHVFAGTTTGVYFLPSGGGTWTDATAGLGNQPVLSLARDASGTVYLGTDGYGVYRSLQTYNRPNSYVNRDESVTPAITCHAYPNPASSQTTLALTLLERSEVRIQLLNTLGEVLEREALGELSVGSHNVGVSTANVPDGAYMVVVTAGGRTATTIVQVAH